MSYVLSIEGGKICKSINCLQFSSIISELSPLDIHNSALLTDYDETRKYRIPNGAKGLLYLFQYVA